MRSRTKLFAVTHSALSVVLAVPAWAGNVALTSEQMQRLEIKLETAKPVVNEPVAVLSGTVIRPLNTRSAATAPYSGTVTEIHVLPGQRVTKGTPLATITSRDLVESETQLAQAEADLQIAKAIARRKRMLAEKNFQSPDVADEAEAQVAKIEAVIVRHKREQSLNGIIVKDSARYVLPANADGVIVQTNVMPGDKVDTMSPVVTIDTGNELWVDVQVPASVVANIHAGDAVMLESGIEGRIVSIAGSLDASTRSAKLYASIPSSTGLLPGQMVSVTLKKATVSGALSVPANAVTRIADKPSVFVKTDRGFAVREIELRGQSPEAATVSGAISAGDQVAASGIPQLEQMLTAE